MIKQRASNWRPSLFYLRTSRARSAACQVQVARVTLLETTRDEVGVEIQREDEGKEAGADRNDKDAGQTEEDDPDGPEAVRTGEQHPESDHGADPDRRQKEDQDRCGGGGLHRRYQGEGDDQ